MSLWRENQGLALQIECLNIGRNELNFVDKINFLSRKVQNQNKDKFVSSRGNSFEKVFFKEFLQELFSFWKKTLCLELILTYDFNFERKAWGFLKKTRKFTDWLKVGIIFLEMKMELQQNSPSLQEMSFLKSKSFFFVTKFILWF